MTESTEIIGRSAIVSTDVFDKTLESWASIGADVDRMAADYLFLNKGQPILGETDDVVIFPNLEAVFESPDSTIVIAKDQEKGAIAGFATAIGIGMMDPTRASETDTAYIYYMVVDESYRRSPAASLMTLRLFRELRQKGFKFAEFDVVKYSGFADQVQGALTRRIDPAQTYDHEKWKEIGEQRHLRIDLEKPLTTSKTQE